MAIARRHAARWTQVFCRQIRTPSCERLDRLGFTSHVEWLSSSDTYNVARRLEWTWGLWGGIGFLHAMRSTTIAAYSGPHDHRSHMVT